MVDFNKFKRNEMVGTDLNDSKLLEVSYTKRIDKTPIQINSKNVVLT